MTKMTKAEKAVQHAIHRVARDPDFRGHMMGTQTLRLMIESEAERRGIDEDEMETKLHEWIDQMSGNQPRAELPALREKFERALTALENIENDDGRIPETVWAMRNTVIATAREL